jgi:RNA polymerase primary sigma factor
MITFGSQAHAAPDAMTAAPTSLLPGRPLTPASAAQRSGASRLAGDDGDSSVLARYLRDMAVHPVLGRNEELEAALAVEQGEVAHWVALLGFPSAAKRILLVLRARIEELEDHQGMETKIGELLKLVSTAIKKGKLTRALEGLYAERSRDLALALRLRDSDRVWMTDARRTARRGVPTRQVGKPPFADRYPAYIADVERTFLAQKEAKNRMVQANLRLVVALARRYDRKKLSFADLIQEGNLGLIKAVEQFDPSRGYRFSTYAAWWIRHALSRGMADRGRAVRLPVHVLDLVSRAGRARRAIVSRTGRQPTLEELALETGVPCAKLEVLESVRTDAPLSLDRPMSDGDDRMPIDWLQDHALSPFDHVASRTWIGQVPALLAELTPSESSILRSRFGLDDGEERTLRELGGEYQVSRERIRQIQARAIDKLRKKIRRSFPDDASVEL